MTSSKPSPSPVEVTIAADTSRFEKSLRRAAFRFRRFAWASRPPRHLPRRSGARARQVLHPYTGKAIRHAWAHERDANGRIVPLVEGAGPLPTREVA